MARPSRAQASTSNRKSKRGAQSLKKSQRNDAAPKRKIGRYILTALVCIPLVVQLRHVDIGIELPEMSLPTLTMPDFSIDDDVEFTNVIIEGEFKYSSKRYLQEQLSAGLTNDFMRLNLSDIQALLLENNWYRRVAVSRVWPSSLKVVIEEEQPIARWGNAAFINRHGEIIRTANLDVLDHYPMLEGRDENAYDIAKSYLMMAQVMADQNLDITKLSVSNDGNWSVEVNHRFEVALGRHQLSERIERFLFLYDQQLGELSEDLKRIDMRYQSGVAVQWASEFAQSEFTNDNDIASR